jgi:hypothetical protein
MEVRKKRSRGSKKEAQGVQASPLNPLSVSPCVVHCVRIDLIPEGSGMDWRDHVDEYFIMQKSATDAKLTGMCSPAKTRGGR